MPGFFLSVLLVTILGSAVAAQEIALVTEVKGEVWATFDEKGWSVLPGENLAVGTGLTVGPNGSLSLIHLSLNQEIALQPGVATITAMGVDPVEAFKTRTSLDILPASVSIEMANLQLLGAFCPQRQELANTPSAPSPAPSVEGRLQPETSRFRTPEGKSETDDQFDAFPENDNSVGSPMSEVDGSPGSFNKSQIFPPMKEKARLTSLRLAIPQPALPKLGTADSYIISGDQIKINSPIRSELLNGWFLLEFSVKGEKTLASTVIVVSTKEAKNEFSVPIQLIDTEHSSTDTEYKESVRHAIRLELEGFLGQAADIWLKLLKSKDAPQQTIAKHHLQRLANRFTTSKK